MKIKGCTPTNRESWSVHRQPVLPPALGVRKTEVWRLASLRQRGRFRLRAIGISRLSPHKHFAGHFLPAAGNRWDGEFNNVGSWGNYWSSTLNESNPNNAYELNFNSNNANWNNNNRNNEQSVRPVR